MFLIYKVSFEIVAKHLPQNNTAKKYVSPLNEVRILHITKQEVNRNLFLRKFCCFRILGALSTGQQR
jgi:hypothetical protein